MHTYFYQPLHLHDRWSAWQGHLHVGQTMADTNGLVVWHTCMLSRVNMYTSAEACRHKEALMLRHGAKWVLDLGISLVRMFKQDCCHYCYYKPLQSCSACTQHLFGVPTHLFVIIFSAWMLFLAIEVGVASEQCMCWILLQPPPRPGAPQTLPPESPQPCTAAAQPADRSYQAQSSIAWQPFACLAGLCLENPQQLLCLCHVKPLNCM